MNRPKVNRLIVLGAAVLVPAVLFLIWVVNRLYECPIPAACTSCNEVLIGRLARCGEGGLDHVIEYLKLHPELRHFTNSDPCTRPAPEAWAANPEKECCLLDNGNMNLTHENIMILVRSVYGRDCPLCGSSDEDPGCTSPCVPNLGGQIRDWILTCNDFR